VAMVVTKDAGADPVWKAIEATPWIDRTRTYVVSMERRPLTAAAPLHIVSDPTLTSNQYRRAGNVVSVAPAVIQSFAAGFIADQLKRTSPPNGSSR